MTSARLARTIRPRFGALLGAAVTAVVAVILTPAGLRLLEADSGATSLLVSTAAAPAVGSGEGCDAPNRPPNPVAAEVFRRVNSDRATAGVATLVWNPQLYCLALEWSKVQGDANTLHHRDLDEVIRTGHFIGYRTLGENLLRGPADLDGDRMHDEWMDSALHRANVLEPSYTSVAIAVHYASDGRVYVTENFGG